MLINEVESITGLSKKSIRYYEDVGLIKPTRTSSNDYRNYTETDINTLKKIKFLRELDVSISDLKKLTKNQITLGYCLEDRIKKLKDYEINYQKVSKICSNILKDYPDYHSLNIDKYSKELNVISKEGFIMNTTNKDYSQKILGAYLSSLIFIIIFSSLIGVITYFQLTEEEKMPIIIYILVISFFIIPIISIIINLIFRIKEIKGGEEDEARKY